MNDYNILALGWLEKKCHFGTELRKDWCHFGTMRWRLGLAFQGSRGKSPFRAGLASIFATWARFCLPEVRQKPSPLQTLHRRLCLMLRFSPTMSPTTKKPNHKGWVSSLIRRLGLEPRTYCLEGSCSIQLSYCRMH